MAAPNFPQKPTTGSGGSMTFPADLIADISNGQGVGKRDFYTSITFVEYNDPLSLLSVANTLGSTIKLPMPTKLNDVQTILWEEWSGTSAAVSGVGGALGTMLSSRLGNIASIVSRASGGMGAGAVGGLQMLGTFTGYTINPFQFMMFKRPNFKEHTLTWTLTPNSQAESDTLMNIIKECKRASLPPDVNSPFIKYPKLANVKLSAIGSDDYLYKFKPCVIVGVQVDYTGSGKPSFFKSGAPTIVQLTLQLKEYQLQASKDI